MDVSENVNNSSKKSESDVHIILEFQMEIMDMLKNLNKEQKKNHNSILERFERLEAAIEKDKPISEANSIVDKFTEKIKQSEERIIKEQVSNSNAIENIVSRLDSIQKALKNITLEPSSPAPFTNLQPAIPSSQRNILIYSFRHASTATNFPQFEEQLEQKLLKFLQQKVTPKKTSFFSFPSIPTISVDIKKVSKTEEPRKDSEELQLILYTIFSSGSRIDDTTAKEQINKLRDSFKVPVVLVLFRYGEDSKGIELKAPYSGDAPKGDDSWYIQFQFNKQGFVENSSLNSQSLQEIQNKILKWSGL